MADARWTEERTLGDLPVQTAYVSIYISFPGGYTRIELQLLY